MNFHILEQFCKTDLQKEVIGLLKKGYTYRHTADMLGMKSHSSVGNMVKRLGKLRKKAELDKGIADGFTLDKVSTLTRTNDDGKKEVILEWTKSSKDKENELQMIKDTTNYLAEKVANRAEPMRAPVYGDDSLLTVYVQTDLHLGQYSWGKEAGTDVNLDIVKRTAFGAISILSETTPKSYKCLVLDIGDTLHASNDAARTKSGHELDTDTRHAKVFETLVDLKIDMIDLALQKHSEVEYVIVAGNHSELVGHYLTAMLKAYYRKEPRFKINCEPTLHKYYKHGKTLLGFHHGHSTPLNRLPEVMVWDKKDDISSTDHRYWLTGHVHKDTVIDNPICRLESFRNLTPNDSWAAGAGFRGHKQAVAITYDKEHGEVARNIANIKLINS